MEVVEVTSYSGHKYAQRPLGFIWSGQEYDVEEVEREWLTPEGPHFLVRTKEGFFHLFYCQKTDEWSSILGGI